MAMSCYLILGASESCFMPFDVTDKIDDPELLNGSVLNLVVFPLGHIVIVLFMLSIVCLKIYSPLPG